MNTIKINNPRCPVSRALLITARILTLLFLAWMIALLLTGCAGTQWQIQREITPGLNVTIGGDGKAVKQIDIR